MVGITESDLWMHRNNDRLDWDTRRAFDIVMRICPPKELTPWMPIAEAPKDRRILLFHPGLKKPYIGQYFNLNGSSGYWDYIGLFYTPEQPTHYQELPADPE